VGRDDRDTALQGGNQEGGVFHVGVEVGEGALAAGVTQQRQPVVGQRLVEWKTAPVGGVEVLHHRQPFQQHGPALDTSLQFGDRVLAIGVDGGAEQHLGVP
jgi:hypothetical protein